MKKWNVLIIGAGNIASGYDDIKCDRVLSHAHAITLSEHFELFGFYDLNYQKAKAAAQKWRVKAFQSLDGLEDEIDIVCCAVPDEYHYEVMKNVAGWKNLKAIICEKPLARNLIHGNEIMQLYKEKKIPIFVNYSRRYLRQFREAKEWIRYNAGDLLVGNCFYGKGTIHNCSHFVNILQFLLGDLEIVSTGDYIDDFFEDDKSREFVLRYNEKKIFFHPIPCNNVTVFEFDIMFTNGRIRYSDEEQCIKYYTVAESSIYQGEQNYVLKSVVKLNPSEAMKELYENVRLFMSNKEDILSDVYSAYDTLNICSKIAQEVIHL